MTEYEELKTRINRHNLRVAEVTGERKSLLKELKAGHDCSTLKEAKTHLRKLARRVETQTEKVETQTQELIKQYGERLGIN